MPQHNVPMVVGLDFNGAPRVRVLFQGAAWQFEELPLPPASPPARPGLPAYRLRFPLAVILAPRPVPWRVAAWLIASKAVRAVSDLVTGRRTPLDMLCRVCEVLVTPGMFRKSVLAVDIDLQVLQLHTLRSR